MDYVVHFVDQLKPHLRAFRKARGLTQTQLSKKLNVVQSRIATIENKPEVMSVEQLFRLLATLGVQLVLRDTSASSVAGAEFPPDDTPSKGAW